MKEEGRTIINRLGAEVFVPAEPGLWWLSFCDPELPEGSQFLGACLVEADDYVGAISTAWRLGINPGGEVASTGPIPIEHAAKAAAWMNRLLSREQIAEMDSEMLG